MGRRAHRAVIEVIAFLSLAPTAARAAGDGTFQAPLTIPVGSSAVTVNYGDFDGDGKLDLVVANGTASNEATGQASIKVLFQDPDVRAIWTLVSLSIGTSAVFVRGADMDGDGIDDIMVGDTGRSAFYLHSRGDRTFETPVATAVANGARWIAIADWDRDGDLDWASSNFAVQNLTSFLNDGSARFTLKQTMPGAREHTLEAMDYDGDGKMDLMQGSGLPGVTFYKGTGTGTFNQTGQCANISCVEYISEAGRYYRDAENVLRYSLHADFNEDGRADLATTCIDDGIAYAGVSTGTSCTRIFSFAGASVVDASHPFNSATDSTAIADLNGDGHADIAMVSKDSTNLWVYLGKGNGTFFSPPRIFSPVGGTPCFLISQDLDADGHFDVISADQSTSSVTVFWGREAPRIMESTISVGNTTGAKAMGLADLDLDGVPDLILPNAASPVINVFLKPALSAPTSPSYTMSVGTKHSLFEVADLDRDGYPDFLGTDTTGGKLLVSLLDRATMTDPNVKDKRPRAQAAYDAGLSPSALKVGDLDGQNGPDAAVACKGVNSVAVFLNNGDGTFPAARQVPTIVKPKALAIGNLDGDMWNDLVVIADMQVVAHYGKGGGDFEDAALILQETVKTYVDVAVGDVTGDGRPDIVVAESRNQAIYVLANQGGRQFAAPVIAKAGATPTALCLADVNGDRLLDVTACSSSGRSISVLLNGGHGNLGSPAIYGFGLAVLGHRVADLDGDGALDVLGFSSSSAPSAMVLLGHPKTTSPGSFRRGDVNADGIIAIDDPLRILFSMFAGAGPLPCQEAADADDDGQVLLTDVVLILQYLFTGGGPLPPPGPEQCGTDNLNPDALGCTAPCP